MLGGTVDRYAGEWPKRAFESHGIIYLTADRSKAELYASFEPLINSGSVELLDHPKFFAQALSLIHKGSKIDHPANEHDDWCNVVAGAISLTADPTPIPGIYIGPCHWRDEFDQIL